MTPGGDPQSLILCILDFSVVGILCILDFSVVGILCILDFSVVGILCILDFSVGVTMWCVCGCS